MKQTKTTKAMKEIEKFLKTKVNTNKIITAKEFGINDLFIEIIVNDNKYCGCITQVKEFKKWKKNIYAKTQNFYTW